MCVINSNSNLLFEYYVELGIPNKNKTVYDGSALICELDGGEKACDGVFYITNLHRGLRLIFSCKDGYVIGAKCEKLNLDSLERESFDIPDFMEGRIRVKSRGGKFITDADYLEIYDNGLSYDEVKGLIAFGNPDLSALTVRACENLFISFGDCGAPVAVIVKL